MLGTTRVGKTRLAEILINQDIMRGDTVITFDPKGDADLMLAMYAAARKAGRSFYMFHLGFPEQSCRYNPIGDFTRITGGGDPYLPTTCPTKGSRQLSAILSGGLSMCWAR